jgi:hypothetical protein
LPHPATSTLLQPLLTYLSAGVPRKEGRVKAWAVATRAKKESVLMLLVRGYPLVNPD